jgi:recombination protein RecT
MATTKTNDIEPQTSDPEVIAATPNKNPVVRFIKDDGIQKMITDRLKDGAGEFTTTLLTAVSNNKLMAECEPKTVLSAAMTAASLKLAINQNLGFAYLIPYKNGKTGKYECQFQMGWKGFVQLAQRTGLYKGIGVTRVYEGQLINEDPVFGNQYDWKAKTSDKIVGYMAGFQLLNGFEKTLFMTSAEANAHGKQYSQSFRKGYGLWSDNFDVMAMKTVVKQLLSKWAPLSVDMQQAIEKDQAVIEGEEIDYVDNGEIDLPVEIIESIENAKTTEELQKISSSLSVEDRKKATTLITEKLMEL